MRASKAERDGTFATFMDQAGPALLRTAWFLTGDRDRAQELTQAALVKTYVVWHKIDHGRAPAYARRCLVNHKIDVWRSTRHEVVVDFTSAAFEFDSTSPGSRSRSPSGSPTVGQDSAVTTTDHRDDLVRRLSRLPEQQRKIVVLRYYADQSEVAVAEALGISVGAVKSAASRGLAALRQHAKAQAQAEAEAETEDQAQLVTHAEIQNPDLSRNVSPTIEGSLR